MRFLSMFKIARYGAAPEPIPELEFDQNLRLLIFAGQMAHAAERGLVWIRRWRGSASGVVWAANSGL